MMHRRYQEWISHLFDDPETGPSDEAQSCFTDETEIADPRLKDYATRARYHFIQ